MKSVTFEPIFKAISIPCVMLIPQNDKFLIFDINEAYLKMSKFTREEVVGRTTCEAFPPNPNLDFNGADVLLGSLRKVVDQKEKDQMEALRYDLPVRGTENFLEKYWDVENIPILNKEGELKFILHMSIDVTQRVVDISTLRLKEEALKASDKRFTLAMKATKEILWDWDMLKNKFNRSKTFKKIIGKENTEESSQPNFWLSRVHPKDRERVKKSLDLALKDPKQQKWTQEYRLLKPDGKNIFIIDRGFIERNSSGKAIRMVGSALDATESKNAVKRIKDQNKLLQEVTWDQSHLVRAPLVRLKGLLNIVEKQDFNQLSHKETLQHLHSSADEIDEIIRATIKKTENLNLTEPINRGELSEQGCLPRHSL